MLSLLAMLKFVTLKGCFHDMQRNAEQQRVKYYRNKRHSPTFKPALSLWLARPRLDQRMDSFNSAGDPSTWSV